MQKLPVPISSFQYGEISESLVMRTDSPVYAQSAQRLENMLVMSEGSVKKRHGLKHIHDYNMVSNGKIQSHLFRFIFDENEEYVISVEGTKIRCFQLLTDGSLSLVSTITQDTDSNPLPFDEDYLHEYTSAQYGDVMFICHPLFAPRMLTRTSLTSFEVSVFTFDARLDGSVIFQPYTRFQGAAVTLDPSGVSGTVTLTTSEDYWVPAHVGSVVRYGTSEIEITAYTSATVVTGTVTDHLRLRLSVENPLRTTDGSAVVEVSQVAHGFAGGEAITISGAAAVGGINTGNINGNFTVLDIIDENTYTYTAGGSASSSEDGGGIVHVTTHAPTTDWDEQSWSGVHGYPAAISFHENRLVFGGTISEPDSIWMSKIGKFFNFDVGDAEDDDSIALVAATGDVNEIRHMVSNRDLQIFTASSELYIPTFLNQAITPTNAQIRKQTPYGIEHVMPVPIDGATIFVANNGRVVREYLYTDSEDAYTANSISTLASHLIHDPIFMTVAHSAFALPDSYAALVMGNGDAALFTSNRSERRAAWTSLTTDGLFASVIAIEDRIFANVYDADGNLHLCEFKEDIGLDFWVYGAVTSNALDVSAKFSDGDTVDVIGINNGVQSYLGSFTVNASNEVDLSAHTGYTHAYAGKKFTAKIVTNPVDVAVSSGAVTGQVRGVSSVIVDAKSVQSMKVNGRPLTGNLPLDGKKEFRLLGYGRDPKVTIDQDNPLQLQIHGMVAELVI